MVTRADGTRCRIDALAEGDEIVAATSDGGLATGTVSLLSIAKPAARSAFIAVSTSANATLTLTAEHHLATGPSCCGVLKKAKEVVVGDQVWAVVAGGTLAPTTVTGTAVVDGIGLHSPVLSNGAHPVVDGLVTAFDSMGVVTLAKHGLGPLLAVCKATGTCERLRGLVHGA